MIRREGRMAGPQPESGRLEVPHVDIVGRRWERPVLVASVIVILVLGGIAALNALIALAQ